MVSIQQQVEQAREYLQRHPNLSELHDKTGLGYWWLMRMKSGETKNPRTDQLDVLLQHMNAHPLPDEDAPKDA